MLANFPKCAPRGYLYVHVLSEFFERSHFCCPLKTWINFIPKTDVPIRLGLLLRGSGALEFPYCSKVGSCPQHLEYLCCTLAASFLMGVYQVPETHVEEWCVLIRCGVAKCYHMHVSFSTACCWRARSCVMNACCSSREGSSLWDLQCLLAPT